MIRVAGSCCILLAVILAFAGCRHKNTPPNPGREDEMLFAIEDDILYLRDVENKIPVGLDASDSTDLFKEIVETWIKDKLLSSLAEDQLPNYEEIERKVAEYKSRLIAAEYFRLARQGHDRNVNPDSIRLFYELHKGEMLAEAPLVKGIYFKVASTSENLRDIKNLIFAGTEESIDRLENEFGGEAIQYEYFVDTWVDWRTVADKIPYRFYDADAFLQSTRNFDTEYNGSTHILHISDYVPSGSEQPFEFACKRISTMMEQVKISSYEKALLHSLIKKAKKDGRYREGDYDPLTHKMRGKNKGKRKKE